MDGNEVTSGVELALRFSPLIALIRGMRKVRAQNYRLLLKFVERFMVLNGEWEGEADMKASLVFGSFNPSDVSVAIDQVTTLLAARAISIATGVKLLIEAGLPIDDAAAEVRAHSGRRTSLRLSSCGTPQAIASWWQGCSGCTSLLYPHLSRLLTFLGQGLGVCMVMAGRGRLLRGTRRSGRVCIACL
jgi:hypothetical protein